MPEVDSDLAVTVPRRGLIRRILSKVGEKALDHVVALIVVAAVSAGGFSFAVGVLRAASKHWRLLVFASSAFFLGAALGLVAAGIKNVRNRLRVANRDRVVSQQRFRYVEYQKELIYNALESVQQALAIDEDWRLDELVERGLLGPSRMLLKREATEDVRLAVLIADEDDGDNGRWRMRWAAGHRLEGVRNYHRPIEATLAGRAYASREVVVFDDVLSEPDFIRNPRATRDFRALVAAPLLINEEVVGALSVVSTIPAAFTDDDVSFVRILAALIDVLLAMERDVARFAKGSEG